MQREFLDLQNSENGRTERAVMSFMYPNRVKPNISKVSDSSILDRARAFLPKLANANEALRDGRDSKGKNDAFGASSTQAVEMTIGVGVFDVMGAVPSASSLQETGVLAVNLPCDTATVREKILELNGASDGVEIVEAGDEAVVSDREDDDSVSVSDGDESDLSDAETSSQLVPVSVVRAASKGDSCDSPCDITLDSGEKGDTSGRKKYRAKRRNMIEVISSSTAVVEGDAESMEAEHTEGTNKNV